MFQVHMIELGLVCGVNEYVFGRLWFEYIQGAITFATFFASSPLAPKCLDTSCRPVYRQSCELPKMVPDMLLRNVI